MDASPPIGSPAYQRRQAHEDGLDVPAALQAEERAAVVEQVELDVPAPPAELGGAIRFGPAQLPAALDDGHVRREERLAHRLRQPEVLVPAQIVEEDSPNAALRIPVGDEEVLACPLREPRVAIRSAGLLQHAVEVRRVLRERAERREIDPAAEPGDVARLQVADVHVHDRHERILRVHDQRDAGGEERLAGDLVRPRRPDLVAVRGRSGAGRRGREARAVHRGEIAAALLEELAAKLAHLSAAAAGPLPGGAAELRAALELLQPGDDAVAQLAKAIFHLHTKRSHVPPLLPPSTRLRVAGAVSARTRRALALPARRARFSHEPPARPYFWPVTAALTSAAKSFVCLVRPSPSAYRMKR